MAEQDPGAPTDAHVVHPVKTSDGLRWHTEPVGDQVRVYVTTPGGRQINRLVSSEKYGREALRQFLRDEGDLELQDTHDREP